MFLILLSFILGVYGEIVVLDISAPVNPNKIVEIKYNGDGFVQSLYLPYLKVCIGKVVDGDNLIWEPSKKGEICHRFKVNRQYGRSILAYADLSRNRQTRFVYYQFANGSWNTVDEQLYLRLYMKMQTERKFDLSDPAKGEICHVQDYCPFGAPSLIYTPQSKYQVRSIVDRDEILWASQDAKCEYVVIHGDVKNPRFVHCFIKTAMDYDTLYFEKISNMWNPLLRDDFFARLDVFDRESEASVGGNTVNPVYQIPGGMGATGVNNAVEEVSDYTITELGATSVNHHVPELGTAPIEYPVIGELGTVINHTDAGEMNANYQTTGYMGAAGVSYTIEDAMGVAGINYVMNGEMETPNMEQGTGELQNLDESYSEVLTNISSDCPNLSFSSDDPQDEFFTGLLDPNIP